MSRQIAATSVVLEVQAGGSIQAAVNEIMWEWDLRGHRARIKVANGVYVENVNVRGVPVGSTARPAIYIEGSGTANCMIAPEAGHAFENWGGQVAIGGFKLTAASGACIYAHDAGQTTIGEIEFGECGRDHVMVRGSHIVRHKADYVISGGANIHAHVAEGARYANDRTITPLGQPHFRQEFHGLNAARSLWTGAKFVGSATGRRHVVHHNADCALSGADAETFFPGDAPGLLRHFSTMA